MKIMQYYWEGEAPCAQIAVWNPSKKGWIDISEFLSECESLAFTTEDNGFDVSDLFSLEQEEWDDLRSFALDPIRVPIDCSQIIYLPILLSPSKILCVGLNYRDHAEEFNDPVPEEPVFFNKAISTLNAHQGAILVPRVSNKIDYEAELVVVIGKGGKNIPKEEALDYVAGYTCGNDVSCRDWQKNKPGGQWFLGKSFDSFAPVGPVLALKDEIPDPNALKIESRLNGKIMQSSNTRNFIFPVEELIAYISQVMTLFPGDLIFTGTPGGVGDRRNPPVYLKQGDRIEIEIEKIGVLENEVFNEDFHY